MSFSFTIPADKPILDEELFSAIGEDDLRMHAVSDEEPKLLSSQHHFYLEDVSCRGIHLEWEGNKYCVRINYPNAREDFELGLKTAEALGKHYNAEIEGESPQKAFPVSDFRKTFDDNWVTEQCRVGADIVLDRASKETDGNVLSLPGPVRPFYIGTRLAQEISRTQRAGCGGKCQAETIPAGPVVR